MVLKEVKDFVGQSEQNASQHKQGGTQRQSTWTVPHGKDTQHGNESTWQLKQGKALCSREGEWAIILRTAPFIGLVQTFPSTGYSTVPKRRTANYARR
eukprot:scaffold13810_cov79-Skeletonema_dohrnii-CCMP3373.AAC.1